MSTPPAEEHPAPNTATHAAASGPPASIPYSAAFEDSLMRTVLFPNPLLEPPCAISVRSALASSNATSEGNRNDGAVDPATIDPATLPSVNPSELPLAISDPRRRYRSAIPNVLTTHPHGSIYGGPNAGPDPAPAPAPGSAGGRKTSGSAASAPSSPTSPESLAASLVQRHRIRTAGELETRVAQERAEAVEEVRARMRARQEAGEANASVERQLRALHAQHDMEMRIAEKIRDEAKKRRESRRGR
ncbi:hypothetical protein BDY21DRAFT_372994 [Lineolata rhizophorae]|uniref:Uncharacterized protein n=1 Tax=Lineolata rhizophorae TaxID=578093 RepID=A0A6A6NWP1_9PEZI|nr:hypothetical protein BDY21DRAFT_372994 [Lineolata rhizophorae]